MICQCCKVKPANIFTTFADASKARVCGECRDIMQTAINEKIKRERAQKESAEK